MKRILLLLAVVVGVAALLYFFMKPGDSNNKEYPVNASVNGYVNSYSITRDDELLGSFSEDRATVQLTPGTHQLVFASEGLISITRQVSVPLGEDKELEVTFVPVKTAENTLKDIAGGGDKTKATRVRFFAGDTWLVGNISTTDDEDTSTIVSQLKNNEWTIVDSGTFIDSEILRESGAPTDLIKYLDELQ